MTTDSGRGTTAARNGRIDCTLHNDPRLITAVGTVLVDAVQRAGLPDRAQEDIAAATVETCRRMFPQSGNNGNAPCAIKLVVTDFPDRVEVAIDAAEGAAPARPTEETCKPLEVLQDERIRCEMREGRVRLTLIKPCGEAKSSKTA